jgi:hypothetical protein
MESDSVTLNLTRWTDLTVYISNNVVYCVGKELYKKSLWTAHGLKLIPAGVDMAIRREDHEVVPACPPFLNLVSEGALDGMYSKLSSIHHEQYETAMCVLRDVRRIPLKPVGVDEEEAQHLSLSSDGMRFFHPVMLHNHNCQSSDGLMAVLARINQMQDFISNGAKSYTILNADVSLYNSLMHVVYGFGGMHTWRRNVFFLFGIWHVYLYAHTAIWDRFRAHFLLDAFFAVFPDSTLMVKPTLFSIFHMVAS